MMGQPKWRRTAVINIALTFSCGISLIIFIIVVTARQPASAHSTSIIYEGDCQRTEWINVLFHAFISLTSSLILASTRFFMQILSSPSRKEIDRAHMRLRSLEIGISSLKNLRFVSHIKSIGWLSLLVSSVPIHLFFNSSVFEVNYYGSDWRLTIASSSFSTQEVAFFPPGASLANAGVPTGGWDNSNISESHGSARLGYGEFVALPEYWDKLSAAHQSITKTAKDSGQWYNMTAKQCLEEYASCRSRSEYRDVVIVVDTETNGTDGWVRSQVFSDPNEELDPIWDSHIPQDSPNSLWYSAQCATYLSTFPVWIDSYAFCLNTCGMVLGLDSPSLLTNVSLPHLEQRPSFEATSLYNANSLTRLGYNNKQKEFNVRYCLAEPSPDYTCRVAMSNTLLIATITCVLLQVLIFTIITRYLSNESLATIGDVLESFITNPDPLTLGLGTLGIQDIHLLKSKKLDPNEVTKLSNKPQPRIWRRQSNRIISVVPKSAWSGTFAPILLFISMAGYYSFIHANIMFHANLDGTAGTTGVPLFFPDFVGNYGYFAAIIVANLPQFLLSYSFFSYNALFTRLLSEEEFNSYALSPPKPLRVSNPKGEQISTYWLQLPFMYSVPLLMASSSLHWLASNSIFLVATRGGYLRDYYDSQTMDKWRLFEDCVAVLGFSPRLVMAFLVLSSALAVFPIVYGFRRLPGDMVAGASDSLVLSAACHPYVGDTSRDDPSKPLLELSRAKLRWGVTPLPRELKMLTTTDYDAMHLSFSNEEEYRESPVDGNAYL
ncbi:hypothetical protein M426DRAFT_10585 [Hypoxylon sp. CI-4A]|nr:hypothetical protein M426DRAFT_10585 [Hypoxylon sp. CI-4A]